MWTLVLIFFTLLSTAQEPSMEIDGSMVIGSSQQVTPKPGSIRFVDGIFEGFNGLTWVQLSAWKFDSTLVDLDGNEYRTVKIGEQIWMAENLRVLQLNDGTELNYYDGVTPSRPLDPVEVVFYNYDQTFARNLGGYYRDIVIESNKLCPTGWRMPGVADFNLLKSFLGGSMAGLEMKEKGTQYWLAPNHGPCNRFGFTARGAGTYDFGLQQFKDFGLLTYFYSYDNHSGSLEIIKWDLEYDNVFFDFGLTLGTSSGNVRCIKN